MDLLCRNKAINLMIAHLGKLGYEGIDFLKKMILQRWNDAVIEENNKSYFPLLNQNVCFSDLISGLFHESIDKNQQQRLGQFQTPGKLCQTVIKNLVPVDILGGKVIEPCCGTGGFVCEIIRMLKNEFAWQDENVLAWYLSNVTCIDIDPMACDLALISILTTLIENKIIKDEKDIVSILSKPILNKNTFEFSFCKGKNSGFINHQKKYDLLIGNPPWAGWEYISEDAREEIKKALSSSHLFLEKGWRARIAAGKLDIATVMTIICSDYFLKENAYGVFLLPNALFKTISGAKVFRQFKTTNDRFMSPQKILCFRGDKFFKDVVVKTNALLWKMDEPAYFPIDAIEYGDDPGGKEFLKAYPLNPNDKTSPWTFSKEVDNSNNTLYGRSGYRAREGVNTGGANGIFWVDIEETTGSLNKI
ncbi:MAG: N-6 DNA methylase, partial [Oligoflexales bacterium]|nr:N-6 DNA methylase [Oligoflexales bacterium]